MLLDWGAVAALNADEFEAAAVTCLEDHLDALGASRVMDEKNDELFADLIARHAHARDAFPGVSFDQFQEMAVAFARKGKKSAPKKSEVAHFETYQTYLALEVEILKRVFTTARGDSPIPPPMNELEIVLRRNEVGGAAEEGLRNHLRRPRNRRPEIAILETRLADRL